MDTNNQLLRQIAGVPVGDNTMYTNNQLLKMIAENGGGGGGGTWTGKSQIFIENGTIDADTTFVHIAGGDTFTMEQPTQDGKNIIILNDAGTDVTFSGYIDGGVGGDVTLPAESYFAALSVADFTDIGVPGLFYKLAYQPSGGGGGGASGKSQVLLSDGVIEADATTVLIAAGADFTIEDPIADGHVMHVTIQQSIPNDVTISGLITGSQQDRVFPPSANYYTVQFTAFDFSAITGTPGLSWSELHWDSNA